MVQDFIIPVSPSYKIQICAGPEQQPWKGLTPVLETLLPLSIALSRSRIAGAAGQIMCGLGSEKNQTETGTNVTSLTIMQTEKSSHDGKLKEITVRFADDSSVPFPFRGRTVNTNIAAEPAILRLQDNERALASTEQGPIWTVRNTAGANHYRTGFTIPELSPDESFNSIFHGERFVEMLPLLHWLRAVCAGEAFEGPPLRACFIFDDPNLHWPRYGYVDYRQIITQAEKENYHVAFATIPLDTWFTHEATAALFRNHPSRVSLLVHGNDHVKHELARPYTRPERVGLLQQALHRIERLEQRAGVTVCRVMVPPHGACSEVMLGELPGHGFEAACISHGSLRAHNPTSPWVRTLGYRPAELILGCPVSPRWGLAGNTTNVILVAAYLKQPLILRGHHQDLKAGLEILNQNARMINSLGPVSWSNMTELSRGNFQWRQEGTVYRLKPLGQKITVKLPGDAEQLVIENSGDGVWESWQISAAAGAKTIVRAGELVTLTEKQAGVLTIETSLAQPTLLKHTGNRGQKSAFVRRLLTESRDRLGR